MTPGNGIVRLLACGSVDDGKSTLIGHLLYLTGTLYIDQVLSLERESASSTYGANFDFSFLLDGLMAEREQSITIDVAHRYFSYGGQNFIVFDAPGHEGFTRNMATAASRCNAALILLDATKGLLQQTRRHALICSLMGIPHLLFLVNKMDLVNWQESPFTAITAKCATLADTLKRYSRSMFNYRVIPVSALHGDNLIKISNRMSWYSKLTVMEWLQGIPEGATSQSTSLRFPVQYVIKGGHAPQAWQTVNRLNLGSKVYRAYAGNVASGIIRCGDQVVVLPKIVRTKVEGIWSAETPLTEATAGMAVSLTLAGDHDIKRGDCITHEDTMPHLSNRIQARLVWIAEQLLYAGETYVFRGIFGQCIAEITVSQKVNLDSLDEMPANSLSPNDIGNVELLLSRSFPVDPYIENGETGNFILIDRVTNLTLACGMILSSACPSINARSGYAEIARDERSALKGHRAYVIWFTGLSASGKSTIGKIVERKLHERHYHTMLLDGDIVRNGLNKDLGFSQADRSENIRRIGQVARLMYDAGLIVITASISPFRSDRALVRHLFPKGDFFEVYLRTPISVCERRDPKGLYKNARLGYIPDLTGINSPYEEPENPEIQIETSKSPPEDCAEIILRYLCKHTGNIKQ